MKYNRSYINNISIFTQEEIWDLNSLNAQFSLSDIIKNRSLADKLKFDFIYTSAKIEGNTYTISEAKTLLETRTPVSTKTIDNAIMILNIEEAFNYILEQKPTIAKHTIKEIHQILSQNLLKNRANSGNIRNSGVYISGSDYVPLSSAYELENELDRVINIYSNVQNSYDKALYIHNNIAYLQCFEDCNKRLARMLQNLSLIRDDKIFFSYNANDKDIVSVYIEAILEYYNSGDYRVSKAFFIKEYLKIFKFLEE